MTAVPVQFLGVRPPIALAERIRAWQKTLGHVITEPHLTLKAPATFSPAELLACEAACQDQPPFMVTLGRVQTFGDRVIFLEARGAGLHRLHAALVGAAGQPASAFELDQYHPHLTLALSWRPMTAAWGTALDLARAAFADVDRVEFEVNTLDVFEKDRPGWPYRVMRSWRLGGGL